MQKPHSVFSSQFFPSRLPPSSSIYLFINPSISFIQKKCRRFWLYNVRLTSDLFRKKTQPKNAFTLFSFFGNEKKGRELKSIPFCDGKPPSKRDDLNYLNKIRIQKFHKSKLNLSNIFFCN